MYFRFCPGLTAFVLCLTAGISSILELSYLSVNVLHLPDESCSQVNFFKTATQPDATFMRAPDCGFETDSKDLFIFLVCLFDILILNSSTFLYIYPINRIWSEHLTVSLEVIVASRVSHICSDDG